MTLASLLKDRNSKIYLAPYNNHTRQLYNENSGWISFIDNYKTGSDIVTPANVAPGAIVVVISPNHWETIATSLHQHTVYILYRGHLFNFAKSKRWLPLFIHILQRASRQYFARRWKYFKNLHRGQRVFLIGNGPSLKIDDLSQLKKEITFAANKIYLAYDQTSWRPTYYCVEDSLVMEQSYAKIVALNDSIRFFPDFILSVYPPISGALYYPLHPPIPWEKGFSDDPRNGLYFGATVMYAMLQLAVYMGFTEIYLIGMDFHFSVPKTQGNADVIISEGECNHFHPDYRKNDEAWHSPKLDQQQEALEIAKHFCETRGIKIYNATREGKLDVFERVNFESLF